jgi:hypothetical protein
MTQSTRATTATESLVYTFRNTLHSIQEWATNQKGTACGDSHTSSDERVIVFENGKRGWTDKDTFGETKTSDEASYLNVLRCTAKDISAAARRSFNCPVTSDDLSCTSEDDQMRRLGSWGTFGTLATNESLETTADASLKFDDDGHRIDPVILEKAKQNREKFRLRKRAVKFAYPPITSLKQCPRVDPTDLDRLFFTTEELDTYENDRRSTGTVDDVEIVAVSTSISDEVSAPQGHESASNTTPVETISDGSQKSGLAKYLSSSPKSNFSRHCDSAAAAVPTTYWGSTAGKQLRRATPRSSDGVVGLEKPKEKRLLKSVQIFLRARSTGN